MRTADLNKLLKDHGTLCEDGHSRPQQQLTFERWTPRTHESRELVRQSEAKRKQVPQSEANVCRHKCNLK